MTDAAHLAADKAQAKKKARSRAFWLRQMRQWHWISAAVCLVGMVLFAATGITLNHAAQIPAKPAVTEASATLPRPLVERLTGGEGKRPVPDAVAAFVRGHTRLDVAGEDGDWTADEVYIALPRPGGDAWVSIDRRSGAVSSETTRRGWIAYLNDLHKGRNTGPAWAWFLDVFAAACILFSVTGLVLLQLHSAQRRITWPLVGLGVLIPLLFALFLIH